MEKKTNQELLSYRKHLAGIALWYLRVSKFLSEKYGVISPDLSNNQRLAYYKGVTYKKNQSQFMLEKYLEITGTFSRVSRLERFKSPSTTLRENLYNFLL